VAQVEQAGWRWREASDVGRGHASDDSDLLSWWGWRMRLWSM
jgi:hypothetical protein